MQVKHGKHIKKHFYPFSLYSILSTDTMKIFIVGFAFKAQRYSFCAQSYCRTSIYCQHTKSLFFLFVFFLFGRNFLFFDDEAHNTMPIAEFIFVTTALTQRTLVATFEMVKLSEEPIKNP